MQTSVPAIADYRALLKRYTAPQWLSLSTLAALLLMVTGLQLWMPQIIRHFIEAALEGRTASELLDTALRFTAAAVAAQLAYAALGYLSSSVSWRATNALRIDLLHHCLGLDSDFHARHSPGEMLSRVDQDVASLSAFLSMFLIRVTTALLVLVGALVVVGREDARFCLLLIAIVVATAVVLRRLQGKAFPFYVQQQADAAALSAHWQQALDGREGARECRGVDYVIHRFHAMAARLMRSVRNAAVMSRVVLGAWEIMSAVLIAAVFALGAILLHLGTASYGVVLVVYLYARTCSDNLVYLTQQFEDLQRASGSVQRIMELLRTQPKLRSGVRSLLPGALGVGFEKVRFEYVAGRPVLNEVSFQIAPQRVLGIVGKTGSGKSTIARLLLRLEDPVDGIVGVGGTDLRDADMSELRSRIGCVSQHVQLLGASIRDNVTLFDPTLADEKIVAAMKSLGLGAWLEGLPAGLDTVIGQAGRGLSAGEAQLLAAVRVFMRDADLIVLDEATSRVDPHTGELFKRAISRLLRGRTGVVIAHRLSTLDFVDDVLVLGPGCVIEHGPRDQLSRNPNAALYAMLAADGIVAEDAGPRA